MTACDERPVSWGPSGVSRLTCIRAGSGPWVRDPSRGHICVVGVTIFNVQQFTRGRAVLLEVVECCEMDPMSLSW